MALCAALINAGRRVPLGWQDVPVRILSPVNIRRELGVGENCGVFVSAASSAFDLGIRDFWELARKAKTDVASGQTRASVEALISHLRRVVGNELDVADIGFYGGCLRARGGSDEPWPSSLRRPVRSCAAQSAVGAVRAGGLRRRTDNRRCDRGWIALLDAYQPYASGWAARGNAGSLERSLLASTRQSCLAPCGAPAATHPGGTAMAAKNWQGIGNIRPPEKSPF